MKIQVKFDDTSSECPDLHITNLSLSNRTERALKNFGILLALTIFSIAIPIFHFILVPAFLISSFIFPYIRFKETSYIDLSHFNCPKCSHPIDEKIIYLKQKNLPIKLFCFNCRTNIKIET